MGSPGSANGRRGEYVRIPEEVEVAVKGEADAATAVKAAAAAECPRVLRWRAIRWWAKIAVLGIFLAGAGAAAVVFLGPLVIKKVRAFAPSLLRPLPSLPPPPRLRPSRIVRGFVANARSFLSLLILLSLCPSNRRLRRDLRICAGMFGYLLIFFVCGRNIFIVPFVLLWLFFLPWLASKNR
jgi:hypothetical protein